MAGPRDMALVVDLSGSMNDDTEPAWATPTINAKFVPKASAPSATNCSRTFIPISVSAPIGMLEWIGKNLSGVSSNMAPRMPK